MAKAHIDRWKAYMESHSAEALDAILADDVVFLSPIVHTPQRGKAITMAYLMAAGEVLGNDSFTYVGEWGNDTGCVLEFETEIDGIKVNGIDMITFGPDMKITAFKVMVRPLKAIEKVHAMMGEMLLRMAPGKAQASPGDSPASS